MSPSGGAPRIGAVIPTLNAGPEWPAVLDALRRQTAASRLDLVVVDSGSADNTAGVAREFGAKVVEIPPSEFNHGGTRNLGARHAKGDYLVFMTQDALPADEYFLEALIASAERHGAAGVCARQIPRPDAGPLTRRGLEAWAGGSAERRIMRIDSMDEFFRSHPMERYLRCVFDNVASLVRRGAWERIPFPEVPFGEDLEWAFRAMVQGYTLVYEPEARVVHSHERSARYAYKRAFVDHYRLYELFRLRTIPSRRKVLESFLRTTLSDWGFMLRHIEWSRRWPRRMVQTPMYAWASARGQYEGARAAAAGRPVRQSREV